MGICWINHTLGITERKISVNTKKHKCIATETIATETITKVEELH